MQYHRHIQESRLVSDFGETLIVGKSNGVNALVDPCDQEVAVLVPVGRRANLIRFSLYGLPGRDAHMLVTKDEIGLSFTYVRNSNARVYLHELSEGQRVDILPSAEPAFAYAALNRPLPVLYGAVAVQPVYAALAA